MKTKIRSFILIIFLILLVQSVPACMAEESGLTTWHQFQRDAVHSGLYQSELPEAYGLLWSNSANAVDASTPVVAEGMVFVNAEGTTSSCLKAFDVNTGNEVWNIDIEDIKLGSWSSPAYNDGMIFTSTGPATTCINVTTGEILWEYQNADRHSSCNGGPMIADGKVFTSDWEGGIYRCLNEYATDPAGEELWNYSVYSVNPGSTYLVGPRAQGTAAYEDGKVILTSYDYNAPTYAGYVYCLDSDDGSELWVTGLEGEACGSASIDGDTVYITTYNFYGSGAAYAMNIADGTILWQTTIQKTDSTPAIAYGNVYISAPNRVYCLDASDGSILWETTGVGGWTNSVAVADDKVFAGQATSSSSYGYDKIVELDAYTGDILWTADGGTVAISDGNIYTISEDGTVYAYSSAEPSVDIITDNVELGTDVAYPYFANEITATITNEGNKEVTNIDVSLLSEGSEVDSQVIPLLGGGCSKEIALSWTPQDSGSFQLTIEASSTDSITETDSTNNAMSIDVTVISGDADLVPTGITPSAVYVDQSYDMKATVKNMGYSVADSFIVEVKEGTKVLASETIPSLGPAQTANVTFNWMSSSSGDVDLSIVADTANSVTESDELNNELVQAIEVKPETSVEVLSDDSWSQFQLDNYNNGVTDDYSPSDDFVSLSWSANDFDGNIDVPPLVVGDIVYVFASSGAVYAYNKDDGTTIWHSDTGETAYLHSSTPAYGDGNIFVATSGGALYAFNSSTGTLQWDVAVTNDSIESPVTYYDHRIYVGDGIEQEVGTKYYYCYDDMGTLLWKYGISDTAGFLWNGATVVGDYVVFSTHEGKLVCLDRKEGTLVDEVNLNSSSTDVSFSKDDPGVFRSSVVYNDGYLYMTSEKGQLIGYVWKVGFNSETGMFQDEGWCSDQIFSTSTPVIYDGKIYVGQGEHGYPGKLICLDDSTGLEIWSYNVSSGVKSSPVVSTYYDTPYIYFTSAMDNGSLYCLNGDGELVWEYNPSDDTGYVLQGAAISEGKAYFGTDGGYLYCVEGDWNIWNDPASINGKKISFKEVQLADFYWQYNFEVPETGCTIPFKQIQQVNFYWQYNFEM